MQTITKMLRNGKDRIHQVFFKSLTLETIKTFCETATT